MDRPRIITPYACTVRYAFFPFVWGTDGMVLKEGFISKIDAYEVGMTAIDIGAGRRQKEDTIDHSAGFIFAKKVGESIKPGETILTIHTNNAKSIDGAKTRLTNAITITPTKPKEQKKILYRVDKNGMKSL